MTRSIFLPKPHGAVRRGTPRLRAGVGLSALGLTTLAGLGLTGPAAHAQTYTQQTLYSFSGSSSDGANPFGSLVNVGGTLYGTTQNGGTSGGYGSVFSFNPTTDTESTAYKFTNTSGANPQAGLTNVGGTLYGTASQGGTGILAGRGTIFTLNPTTDAESTVYKFAGATGDGSSPKSGLVYDSGTSKLYGTDNLGGSNLLSGIIYSFNPTNNTESKLYSFPVGTSSHGSNPVGDLVDVSGVLYGMTNLGGSSSLGTIFSYNISTNTETGLYSFTGGSHNDGSLPSAGMVYDSVDGILYGTTYAGGSSSLGTIFSYNISTNKESTLYSFTGLLHGDGSEPDANLLFENGLLYGTTTLGGSHGLGTAFSFDPLTDTESILYSFTGGPNNDGATPSSGLLDINGTLYGTTQYGGSSSKGTVYSLTQVTPEPASWAAFAFGGFGLLGLGWKTRKRAK